MAGKEAKSTTRKIVTNDQANYYLGITSITVNGKNAYELKGKFLDDLQKMPLVDKLRVVIFPISLVGDACRWFDGIKESITSWVDFTSKFFEKYYPPSYTGKINTSIIKRDPTNLKFKNWLASKFVNCKTMDIFTKGDLWDYLKLGSDEIEPTNEESFDLEETDHNDEQEIGEIFRIETNLFDYETPTCEEFNYLLKIDLDLLTKDTEGFKTYKEFKDNWIYKWNKDVPWDNGHEDDERCELFDNHESPVFNIRRFETIKYSFGDEEEYVAVKEDEYEDLTSTSEDACRAYQINFRMMDEGWMDIAERKEIDDVGGESTIWKFGSVGVLKHQDDCSTRILAHKLNLENLPSKISGKFLILILLILVFNVLSIQRGRCIIKWGDGN
nr:hypothetical protein [Tanacetum cinerariifolium]